MINTEKGKELFESVAPLLEYEKRSTEEAVEGNSQLQHASLVGKHRENIISFYKQENVGMRLIQLYGASTEKTYKKRVRTEAVKSIGIALGLKKLKNAIKNKM